MTETLFESEGRLGFGVTLDVYSGPFDVLLGLISKKKLDITEVALAEVTDDFIEYAHARAEFDLSTASEFLLIASTLLALKASRLLPATEDDEEDIELLEARDVLFAKLLQYRAYKELAVDVARAIATNLLAAPRDVPLEPHFAKLLPEVDIPVGIDGLAALATAAFTRDTSVPTVSLDHLHAPTVSVESQVTELTARLRGRTLSFAELCADAPNAATVVSRFLAVLELLRQGSVSVDQEYTLGELVVSWNE